MIKSLLIVGTGSFIGGAMRYLLLTTGVCGGFTTFSAFAHESVQMLQQGNTWGFVGYVATSVVAGLALIALGYGVARGW